MVHMGCSSYWIFLRMVHVGWSSYWTFLRMVHVGWSSYWTFLRMVHVGWSSYWTSLRMVHVGWSSHWTFLRMVNVGWSSYWTFLRMVILLNILKNGLWGVLKWHHGQALSAQGQRSVNTHRYQNRVRETLMSPRWTAQVWQKNPRK